MMGKNIKVALYYRISKEDLESNNKDDSDSIGNQGLMLTQYARNKNWVIYDEYIDDGLSGTNFDRDEFKRMERDIENGEIDVILVKDQSRLARNFAGVDVFLYDYLIQHKVRCIGVTDGLDNFNQDNKKATQVTGLTNEWYAEDISLKVRGSFDAKRKAGQFIGAIAPYGYKKHPDNKNQLIVDEGMCQVNVGIFFSH